MFGRKQNTRAPRPSALTYGRGSGGRPGGRQGGRLPRKPVGHTAKRRRKDRQGVALIIASVLITLGIGGAMAALQPKPYDEATLCPSESLPLRTLVLVDRSDALISPDRVRRMIETAESQLPVHGRLSVYEIGASGGVIGDALFDLCNPGRGAQVSPIYRNPRRVQSFYEDQFRGPLDGVLTDITKPIQAPTSPIAESIAELLRRAGDEYGSDEVRLIVVSDFLQNTSALGSAYRKGPALQPDSAADMIASARGERRATIDAYLMQRDRNAATQEQLRRDFWEPVFARAGVSVFWR